MLILGCQLGSVSKGLLTILFREFNHLRYGFGGEDWKKVGYQEEPVLLVTFGVGWAHSAQRNSLTIIGASASSVDQRRMEPVHIEMLVVDEKAFAHSRVSIIKRVDVKSRYQSPLQDLT